MDQSKAFELLKGLMSSDGEERHRAEEIFEKIAIGEKLNLLLSIMSSNEVETAVRSLAAVLIRRLFVTPKIMENFSDAVKLQHRIDLLSCLDFAYDDDGLRKKVCDAVAELARSYVDEDGNNTWPEVLTKLFQLASSTDPKQRMSALHLFEDFPGIFGNQEATYINVIVELLYKAMTDSCEDVRFAAALAFASFVRNHETDLASIEKLKTCVPPYVDVITKSIAEKENEDVLKSLVDLAEDTPLFLRPSFNNLSQIALQGVSNAAVKEESRHLLIEFLITISETASSMFRKHFAPNYLKTLVDVLLHMMVQLKEDPTWSQQDEIEDIDETADAIVGETSLDRLAASVSTKILPFVLENVHVMLASDDWKQRSGGLIAISTIGEGCERLMRPMIGQIVDGIVKFLSDPHPRVRYAACNAIGQMAEDFGPQLQKMKHDVIIPHLMQILDDDLNPRVQAHGAAALVNFFEQCPLDVLQIYIDPVLAKLEVLLARKYDELLANNKRLVLEQLITTVAAIGDAAGQLFLPYYDKFMPSLKFMLVHFDTPETRLLKGKIIECVSLLGLAVGKEKFLPDCNDIMAELIKIKADFDNLEADDIQVSFLMTAFSRICTVIGPDFGVYLPALFEPVFQAASFKPQITLLPDDEAREIEEEEDEWEFLPLGDQQNFGIRTTGLEYKANACSLLVCFVRDLKDSFSPYLERVSTLMVSLLKFYFHDAVRSAAAESIPYLLECSVTQGHNIVVSLWQFIFPELLKAVSIEPQYDVLVQVLSSLSKSIELLFPLSCLTQEQIAEIVGALCKRLDKHFENHSERIAQKSEEDFDEECAEELDEESECDALILSKISDVMHSFFKCMRVNFLPFFDQIHPYFVRLISAERPYYDRQWAVCVFDDLIEFTGPHSFKYKDSFLNRMGEMITDNSCEVRQAVAYGIGLLAVYGEKQYSQFLANCMQSLFNVITAENSRNDENELATENAISSVCKILKYNNEVLQDSDAVLQNWLSWLPTYEDQEESEHIYGYLCELIENGNPIVLGIDSSNVPIIIRIFAECFRRGGIDLKGNTVKKMISIIQRVQTNEKVSQACLQMLSEEQKDALKVTLTEVKC